MARFGLCGKFTAAPGKRDELVDLLLDAANGLGQLPECEIYIVNKIDDEPDAVWVTEVWSTEEAHARSLQDPAVQAAIARGRPLIAGMSDQVKLRPVGGKGL
jgi:quinol monooxygenase YgiN